MKRKTIAIGLIAVLAVGMMVGIFNKLKCQQFNCVPSDNEKNAVDEEVEEIASQTIVFEGEDYSICVPSSGWIKDGEDNGGYDCWITEMGDALVSVTIYRDVTVQEVYDRILLTHEGFEFENMDDDQNFSGIDSFNEIIAFVRLIQVDESVLVVWAEHMYETSADVKTLLEEIVETVQVDER